MGTGGLNCDGWIAFLRLADREGRRAFTRPLPADRLAL